MPRKLSLKKGVSYDSSHGGSVWATVDRSGRVLIPAEVRRELGLEPGSAVQLIVEGDSLRLRSRAVVVREAQDRLQKQVPSETRLADELIADRRREADSK